MTSTALELWQPPAARPPKLSFAEQAQHSARQFIQETSRKISTIRYRNSARGTTTGKILVLIPAHDEEASIGRTITALKRQSRVPDRIVVVADNCSDKTVSVARAYGAVVMETRGNRDKKTGALNQGWEAHHKGFEFVAGVDADTVLDPSAIEHLETELREDRNVGGVMARYTFDQGSMLVDLQRLEFSSWTDDLLHKRRNTYVLGGQCSLFRGSALLRVADKRMGVPWDTSTLVEDMKLTGDLRGLGYKTTVHPEARAYAGSMPNLKSLWAQRQKWDMGMVRLLTGQGINRWTATLWRQQLGLLLNGFTRLAFIVMLTASLSAGKYVWNWWWAIPPAVAVILNVKQAMRMPNRRPRDVLFGALLVPVEFYLIFRTTCAAIAWAKVLTGSRADGWGAQKRAESGKGGSFKVKAVTFMLLVAAAIYGIVTAWRQLPGSWQDKTLISGWYFLGAVTAVQVLMMIARIIRPSRGMRP